MLFITTTLGYFNTIHITTGTTSFVEYKLLMFVSRDAHRPFLNREGFEFLSI